MHVRRALRPLAAAGICAIAVLACASASAAPGATSLSAATSPSGLYAAPPLIGVSPPGCLSTYCFLDTGNWTGYDITSNRGEPSFLGARANFSVPSVNCAKTATGYASQAAALGGINNSSGMESDGVTAACVSGTASYEAWWETYPDPQTDVFSVSPGDAIAAAVSYDDNPGTNDGQYEFTLTDQTTGQSFSLWESCPVATCLNTAAQVGSLAPSDASNGLGDSILPLADYGAANFVGASVTEQSGQTVGFLISSSATSYQVTQQSATTGDILASPGPLYGGEAFSDTWQNSS